MTLETARGLAFDVNGILHVVSLGTDEVLRYGPAGQAALTVSLSEASASAITVNYTTTNGTARVGEDYTGMSGTLTFAPGVTTRTILIPTSQDNIDSPSESFFVTLSNPSANATIADDQGEATILWRFQPTELFADSFESGQWGGKWVEDSQNDWFTSTQRTTDGSYAAEVDGSASDATLTMAQAVDMTPYGSAELNFDWYIESGLDTGEYLALDLFNGTSWQEVAKLRGNVDAENTWHHEVITIDGEYLVDNFQLRFRAKMSGSDEDANVDNVQLMATSLAAPPNQASSITSTPVITATEDAFYGYDIDATDPDVGDTLTFSLDGSPTGMTINSTTGVIQWTPTNDHVGGNSVTVRVQDAAGDFDTQSFSIDVANTNDAPTITSSAVTASDEDALYSYDVQATDPDVGDVLAFSLDTAPSTMTIDPVSGLIQWTPVLGDAGEHSVTVRVTDSGSLFDTQSFTLTVNEANVAPTITSTPPLTVNEDTLYSYDVEAFDPNTNETLTFSLDVAPTGMTINATTGRIEWTPDNDDVGDHAVTVRVEDAILAYDTQDFNVAVANVNDPPTITSTPVTSATEDELYAYDVDATDPDAGDTLTYSLDVSPAGMSINPTSGLIQWTPTSGQVNAHNVTVRVTDGTANDTQVFTVTVDAVATGPALDKGLVLARSDAWTPVTLDNTYSSMVAVLTPSYDRYDAPMVARMREVSGNTIEVKLDRTDGQTGAITGIPVHYMVVEEGVYTLSEDGVTMEAVKFTSTRTDDNNSWVGEARSYQQSYSQPVVVGQVMSYNDPGLVGLLGPRLEQVESSQRSALRWQARG